MWPRTGIAPKLLVCFLFIALLPLAIATYISYGSSRKAVEKEARERLFAIADNKANQIAAYLHEKESDITQLSFMSDLRVALEKFQGAYAKSGLFSPEYNAVDAKYRPFLAYYRRSSGYDDILLVSPEGEVVFSAKKKQYPKLLYKMASEQNTELANVFIKTTKLSSLKTEVSNFTYDPEDDKITTFIGVPVLNEGNYAGTLIARMDTGGIFKLVRDYTGLGKTGETIIAAKMGSNAVIIGPLRFDAMEPGLKKRIPLGSDNDIGVQKAVQGKKGSGISSDYRGKETLAIWNYLPSFRLGIVVKMDTREVFVSSYRLRNILLITSLALIAIVVIVAIIVAKSISGPVKELTKVSGVITRGELSKRADVETEDEIGELAHSFNQMTDSLVEAKTRVEEQKTQLEKQKKLLEKVNKELDSFVYTASHDLRAPLRAISSFSGFLEEDYKNKLGTGGKEQLSEIRKGASRMNVLIEDLLKLSRISRVKNPYEDVDVNALIKSVTERIKFDIDKSKVDLKIQAGMPRVYCDRIKMAEVFLNLINNAVKFSSKNSKERPKVEIGYSEEGGSHAFFVKDNGIGVDPKFKDEIFMIFRRLKTADKYEGTGAGLAIAKRIIDDHNGRIWVESKPGKGATFRFTIPKQVRHL